MPFHLLLPCAPYPLLRKSLAQFLLFHFICSVKYKSCGEAPKRISALRTKASPKPWKLWYRCRPLVEPPGGRCRLPRGGAGRPGARDSEGSAQAGAGEGLAGTNANKILLEGFGRFFSRLPLPRFLSSFARLFVIVVIFPLNFLSVFSWGVDRISSLTHTRISLSLSFSTPLSPTFAD